jgi:ketosteroid isomerase-like protein
VRVSDARREALERILDGFNAHDLDAIMEHFADDALFLAPRGPDPWGRRYEGKAAVREGLGARFTGIPDVHYEDRGHFVDGDRGCSQWTLTGTTTDGVRIEVHGCDLWTFRGDEVVVKDAYWKIVEP